MYSIGLSTSARDCQIARLFSDLGNNLEDTNHVFISSRFDLETRYLRMIISTKYLANCNFCLMKTQINWIICDRDISNSWIFGNLELMKTGLILTLKPVCTSLARGIGRCKVTDRWLSIENPTPLEFYPIICQMHLEIFKKKNK